MLENLKGEGITLQFYQERKTFVKIGSPSSYQRLMVIMKTRIKHSQFNKSDVTRNTNPKDYQI